MSLEGKWPNGVETETQLDQAELEKELAGLSNEDLLARFQETEGTHEAALAMNEPGYKVNRLDTERSATKAEILKRMKQ